MINKRKRLVFLFAFFSFSFAFVVSNSVEHNQIVSFAESGVNTTLEISNEPYLKRISLGADFYTEVLEVKFNDELTEDYTLNGHDKYNLGEQKITVHYVNEETTFNIFVSNEFALVGDFINRDLFISKILWNNGIHGLELFNATYEVMSLNNFHLELQGEEQSKTITFDEISIDTKKTLTISFNESFLADVNQELDIDESILNVMLLKEDVVHDLWNSTFIEDINDNEEIVIVNRHPSILSNNDKGNNREWFYHSGVSKFGYHVINENLISYQEQSRAFVRYVMFGAGMFAQGRVEEAFLALRTEFELMHMESIKYFLENANEKVRGINEEGKEVEVSFKNAYERINVLANRSGHSSFISTRRSNSFNLSNSFLIIALIGSSLCGYTLLLLITKYQRKQNYDKIIL